jgi:hypothetical protein
MYRKALVNGQFLYFVHAPPQTELDTKPEAKRPAAPDPNQPRLYNSVYYYWWAFLRLNGDYMECCANGGRGPMSRIYKDFGDIRDGQRRSTDPKAPSGQVDEFREWWIERGAMLFAEPQTKQNLLTFEDLPKSHDMSGRVLLSVPLAGNIDVTLHAIGQMLRPMFRDHAKAHGHYSRARCKPEDGYRIHSLHQALRIAEAEMRARAAGEKKTLYELVDYSGLPFNWTAAEDRGDDINARKTKIASEALGAAVKLIANVGRGRFPLFDEPRPGDFIFRQTRPRKPKTDLES